VLVSGRRFHGQFVSSEREAPSQILAEGRMDERIIHTSAAHRELIDRRGSIRRLGSDKVVTVVRKEGALVVSAGTGDTRVFSRTIRDQRQHALTTASKP
jgi:hypothetical protein